MLPKACTHRKVLEENKDKGTRKLEVAHRAVAKFLFISVTFETHLFVWEDDIHRKIRFCNAKEGFMKKFEGGWHIQPFSEKTLKDLSQHQVPGPTLPAFRLPGPLADLHTSEESRHGTNKFTMPNPHPEIGNHRFVIFM